MTLQYENKQNSKLELLHSLWTMLQCHLGALWTSLNLFVYIELHDNSSRGNKQIQITSRVFPFEETKKLFNFISLRWYQPLIPKELFNISH